MAYNNSYRSEIAEIKKFIREKRREYDIVPGPYNSSELSCEGFGEHHNLFRQLLRTCEDEWFHLQLNDPKIRALAFMAINSGRW